MKRLTLTWEQQQQRRRQQLKTSLELQLKPWVFLRGTCSGFSSTTGTPKALRGASVSASASAPGNLMSAALCCAVLRCAARFGVCDVQCRDLIHKLTLGFNQIIH